MQCDPLPALKSINQGIGAACAIALAQAGASICLVQREPPSGNELNTATADAIRTLGGSVKTVYCDLTDLDTVRELFSKALEVMGGNIHVLVNCAGIQRRSPSVNFSEKDWDDVCYLSASIPCSISLSRLSTDLIIGNPVLSTWLLTRFSISTSNRYGCFHRQPAATWFLYVEEK